MLYFHFERLKIKLPFSLGFDSIYYVLEKCFSSQNTVAKLERSQFESDYLRVSCILSIRGQIMVLSEGAFDHNSNSMNSLQKIAFSYSCGIFPRLLSYNVSRIISLYMYLRSKLRDKCRVIFEILYKELDCMQIPLQPYLHTHVCSE